MAKAKKEVPNPEICRTKSILSDYMMQCLGDDPKTCSFAIAYGEGFYCRHSDRQKFENPANRSAQASASGR